MPCQQCGGVTFTEQAASSIAPSIQSGNSVTFTPQAPVYRIQEGSGCCCGTDDAVVVPTGQLYDGTWFYDGTIFYE